MTASVATSIPVSASAIAPSRTARSADGVAHAAAKDGWWLTEPFDSMPMSGWIVGIRSETFAMSVESVGGADAVVVGGEAAAERLGVAAVRREQRGVRDHVRVGSPTASSVKCRARGARAGLEAGVDARDGAWRAGRRRRCGT